MARKPAAERRAQLIEAGLRVIAREGMHGATVRAIVAEAGVPLATFHYVFASRDEMIGEAYAFMAAPTAADLQGLPEDATPEAAALAMLSAWFEAFVAHPEYELAVMEIMAYCRRSETLAHLPALVQARYVEAVGEVVEALRQRFGTAPGAPTAEEVSQLVLHVTDGLTYHWLRTRDSDASRRWLDASAPMLASAMLGRA
ncbi:TetR/AcrR family transcriptional regulator [Agrococcus carbonis]|uniref:DNA-binding transcriptional regulator YbjK n=1 Tax=Agrococcus carbonis TaxID=684552 RepID=A0A1H1LZC7_9MICO|nr:TetR family transcriptional regulator [Agrococcus carbonis]SDR79954.1 DNA-binding transcriptional regulator YbjK [Agrococcus carbonis]